MSSSESLSGGDLAHQRFCEFLSQLAERGISQQDVAARLNIAPQYISDVKGRRRAISELFARRLEEEFSRPRGWFLALDQNPTTDVGQGPPFDRSAHANLPLLADPIIGDPYHHERWDGAKIEICGVAAVRALAARWPYVLRLGINDQHSRLQKHDLLLISQQIDPEGKVLVVDNGDKKPLLARRHGPRGWEPLNKNRHVEPDATPVGCCLGIVWAAL